MWYPQKGFWRGAQSAVFYYVSCAPCSDARFRKKRKKEAARDRADRELLEVEMGGTLYRHPSPSSTNAHWQAEIALGPSTARRKKKTNTADSQRGLKSPTTQSSNASNMASSVDLPHKVSDHRDKGFKQYQREDEELWGSIYAEPPLRSCLDGSDGGGAPRKPEKAVTKGTASHKTYRNPPISDMVPAVATKVHSREDVAWMMQPPPVADIMSGKLRVPRSRSNSGSSRAPASVASTSLSRQMSNRLIEKKLRNGDTATPSLSRESSGRTADGREGQQHDRSRADSTTEERDFANTPSKRQRRRPSPLLIKRHSEDSAMTVIHNTSLAPDFVRKPQPRKVVSRPQLSTILSDSLVPYEDHTEFYTPAQTPKENSLPSIRDKSTDSSGDYDKTARRSALLVKDDSLKALQEVAPKSALFNTQIFATSPPVVESKIRLPAKDGDEERKLFSPGGPELFDSWYTPEFELDKWVHEHTKREVRQRWSMDI